MLAVGMEKDHVFLTSEDVKPFEFNEQVARCFDDMVTRSVPFYREVHSLLLDVLRKRTPNGGTVVDLGCSTGTTISVIGQEFSDQHFSFFGVDNSESMLERAQKKIEDSGVLGAKLFCEDIADFVFPACDVVIMNYTLQFVPEEKRRDVLRKIYNSLRPGGVFFMAEKIKGSNLLVDDLMTGIYYDFKRRQGYSELEISNKRQALENVLVPWKASEHLDFLKDCGFENRDMLFRWYNFATFVGIK